MRISALELSEHSSSINQRMDNPRDGDTMEFWTAHNRPVQTAIAARIQLGSGKHFSPLCESLSQSNVPFKWSPLPLLSVCTNQAAGLPVPPLSDWRQSCTRGEPRAAPNCQTQVKHNLYTVTTKY